MILFNNLDKRLSITLYYCLCDKYNNLYVIIFILKENKVINFVSPEHKDNSDIFRNLGYRNLHANVGGVKCDIVEIIYLSHAIMYPIEIYILYFSFYI